MKGEEELLTLLDAHADTCQTELVGIRVLLCVLFVAVAVLGGWKFFALSVVLAAASARDRYLVNGIRMRKTFIEVARGMKERK